MAQTNLAIRHISVALAAQHECEDYSPGNTANLAECCDKHYATSLRLINQPSRGADLEAMLVISHLYFAFSSFQDVSVQTGDALSHLTACAKILRERRFSLKLSTQIFPRSNLVDSCLEPFSLRLERALSLFILPTSTPVKIDSPAQISRPELPRQLEDLSQAKRLFVDICRWRYRPSARSLAWTLTSNEFKETRLLFVRLYGLLKIYKDDAANQSATRRLELVSLLTEYRLLYLGMVYSARPELWTEGMTCPCEVDLRKEGILRVTFAIPRPLSHMFRDRCQRNPGFQQRHRVTLWPKPEFLGQFENAGLFQLTLGI